MVQNPASGLLYSTNQSPLYVSEDSDNLKLESLPKHGGIELTQNNRSLRLSELFSPKTNLTFKEFEEIKKEGRIARNRSYHNSIRVNNGKSYDGRKWNLDYKAVPENKARGKELAKQWYQDNKAYKKKYDELRRKGIYFNKSLWEKWVAEGCLPDSIYIKIDKRDMKEQRRNYESI